MKYREDLFLRKRLFELDTHGVRVIDDGLFRTTSRYIKFKDITSSYYYHKDSLANEYFMILMFLAFSVYVPLKFFNDFFLMILSLGFLIWAIYMIIDIIKESKYMGTIFFRNIEQRKESGLFFKSSYPYLSLTQEFLDELRMRKVYYHFEDLVSVVDNNHVGFVSFQENYLFRLNALKKEIYLSEDEYSDLMNRLQDYFTSNDIPSKVENDEMQVKE